ncbi:MAG: hypothetical protein MSG64_02710 [Pyrinomonadaceae bacterium MAG19_C2-C3]|nr:hypothetical protein [Pyrinomonadaceae bacterium MAG19_C2-C3]
MLHSICSTAQGAPAGKIDVSWHTKANTHRGKKDYDRRNNAVCQRRRGG